MEGRDIFRGPWSDIQYLVRCVLACNDGQLWRVNTTRDVSFNHTQEQHQQQHHPRNSKPTHPSPNHIPTRRPNDVSPATTHSLSTDPRELGVNPPRRACERWRHRRRWAIVDQRENSCGLLRSSHLPRRFTGAKEKKPIPRQSRGFCSCKTWGCLLRRLDHREVRV